MTLKPNVVLICVDQWRGDCLSIEGHPVVHTPFLDQLALDGCRFRRAYSATPTCIPARAALYTGLSQKSHGRVGYQDGVPWTYPITIAGEFTRHGYQTQAIGKMHVYPERLQMGFQNVILHDGYLHFARKGRHFDLIDDYVPWLRSQVGQDADYFDHGVNCNSVVGRPWDKEERLHPTNFVVTQAIDFLRRRDPTKPFFLFLSFHRPHPPYDPPRWAFEQYNTREMPAVPKGDWLDLWADYDDPHRPDCLVGEIREDVLHAARAGYYGHMSHIDHQINRLVEILGEYDIDRNTWICFTSDHGEMLGDHNLFRKAYPYEGSARIPLIIKGPPDSQARLGAVHDQVVELRDVMPTLLDSVGLPIPPNLEGKSVLPIAQGQELEWRGFLHGEHLVFRQSLQWLTDGREKYVWCSGTGQEQLFDIQTDPQELRDLSSVPEFQERLAHWRDLLVDELADREEGFTDGQTLIPGKSVKACITTEYTAGS
jgi:arylsulfatase A-like enzyme